MKLGDLVKLSGYRGIQYVGIGLITKEIVTFSRPLYGVRWLDGITGSGSYHAHELEVLSEC